MNNKVRYINTDIFKGVYQPIRTKNAYAIGFIKGKGGYGYIVTLDKDYEGNKKMKIHTYINDVNKVVEHVDDELVDTLFHQMVFY